MKVVLESDLKYICGGDLMQSPYATTFTYVPESDPSWCVSITNSGDSSRNPSISFSVDEVVTFFQETVVFFKETTVKIKKFIHRIF